MRRVEVSEGAATPEVELVVQGDGGGEEACADFSHANEGQLFEQAGHILASGGRAGA